MGTPASAIIAWRLARSPVIVTEPGEAAVSFDLRGLEELRHDSQVHRHVLLRGDPADHPYAHRRTAELARSGPLRHLDRVGAGDHPSGGDADIASGPGGLRR